MVVRFILRLLYHNVLCITRYNVYKYRQKSHTILGKLTQNHKKRRTFSFSACRLCSVENSLTFLYMPRICWRFCRAHGKERCACSIQTASARQNFFGNYGALKFGFRVQRQSRAAMSLPRKPKFLLKMRPPVVIEPALDFLSQSRKPCRTKHQYQPNCARQQAKFFRPI